MYYRPNMFNFCVFKEANSPSGTLLIRPHHREGERVTESERWPCSHTVGLRETVTGQSISLRQKKTKQSERNSALGQEFMSSAAQLFSADISLLCSWHGDLAMRPVRRHVPFHSHLPGASKHVRVESTSTGPPCEKLPSVTAMDVLQQWSNRYRCIHTVCIYIYKYLRSPLKINTGLWLSVTFGSQRTDAESLLWWLWWETNERDEVLFPKFWMLNAPLCIEKKSCWSWIRGLSWSLQPETKVELLKEQKKRH